MTTVAEKFLQKMPLNQSLSLKEAQALADSYREEMNWGWNCAEIWLRELYRLRLIDRRYVSGKVFYTRPEPKGETNGIAGNLTN